MVQLPFKQYIINRHTHVGEPRLHLNEDSQFTCFSVLYIVADPVSQGYNDGGDIPGFSPDS